MSKRKSTRKKRKLSFYKIAGILLFIVTLIFGIFASLMDVLPTKYYILLIFVLILINIIIDFFLFRKKAKKSKKRIACGFAIIFMLVMVIASTYFYKTLEFLWGIGLSDYKVENYSVIVLKNSEYEKISDIKGLTVGYYENTVGSSDAVKELNKEVSCKTESYTNISLFASDLLESKVDSLLVEESILNMLYEDEENFKDSIKVIHTFSVKIKTSNDAKDVNVVKEPFNIYITGIDTYGEISSVSRSDVNIVMTVNPATKQVLLTSIPRDYYVELHGIKGSRDKLTHAGIYGTDMSISTIEDLLDIEINYYLKVNFSSFIDIVNALGGIEAYSKYSFTSIDGYSYKEGYNKMNGEEALSFARERKAFADGDRQRGADQQAVIEAVISKACSKDILSKYSSLLDSIEGEFETNMSRKKITSLIKMQLNDMAKWTVTSIGLDGFNGNEYTYTGGSQKLYVMIPDDETITQASKLINDVINGEKLTGSYEMKRGSFPVSYKKYETNAKNNEKKVEESNKVETVEKVENSDKNSNVNQTSDLSKKEDNKKNDLNKQTNVNTNTNSDVSSNETDEENEKENKISDEDVTTNESNGKNSDDSENKNNVDKTLDEQVDSTSNNMEP